MPSKDLEAAIMLSLEGCTLEWISGKGSTAMTSKLLVGPLNRIAHANWCTNANGTVKPENTARLIRDNKSWCLLLSNSEAVVRRMVK
jgi:hypothetical protein